MAEHRSMQVRALQMAAHVPRPLWWPAAQLGSTVLATRPPRPLRQWQLNAETATGRSFGWADRRMAQLSWFRNTVGSLQLDAWPPDRIVRSIEVDEQRIAWLKNLHSADGLVLAMPHLGSWDLAAGYASVVGLPVTTVAERLPAGQFEYFRELRARLGFEVYPYDQPDLVSTLCEAMNRGRVVCLVADRDFGGRGVPVRWPTPDGGRQISVPRGPAAVAQLTSAALVGIGSVYAGRRLRLTISNQITNQPGAAGLAAMAQQLVEFFASQVDQKPTDWHMMQPFFPGVRA